MNWIKLSELHKTRFKLQNHELFMITSLSIEFLLKTLINRIKFLKDYSMIKEHLLHRANKTELIMI